MVGNDWPPDGAGIVAAVEWRVIVHEFSPGPQSLVRVIIAYVPVELIRSVLASHNHLNITGGYGDHRERIRLYRDFLNGVGIRSQVENAWTDITRHIHSVHHIHVSDASPSVRAGIDLSLRGVIVGSGTGASSDKSQPNHSWHHSRQGNQVSPLQGTVRDRLRFQCQLCSRICRIYRRSLTAYFNLFRNTTHGKANGHV